MKITSNEDDALVDKVMGMKGCGLELLHKYKVYNLRKRYSQYHSLLIVHKYKHYKHLGYNKDDTCVQVRVEPKNGEDNAPPWA